MRASNEMQSREGKLVSKKLSVQPMIMLLSMFFLSLLPHSAIAQSSSDQTCFVMSEFENGTVADADVLNCNFEITTTRQRLVENRASALENELQALAVGNVITVAKSGGQFADIPDAVAAAVAAEPALNNPIVIKIGPGNYNISEPLVIPSYVYVEGITPGTASISCGSTFNCPAIFDLGDGNTRIANLSLENRGTNPFGVSIFGGDNCNVVLDDLQIEVWPSGTGTNVGISSSNCADLVIKNSAISVKGGAGTNIGMRLRNNRSVRVNNVQAEASGAGTFTYGVSASDNVVEEYEGLVAWAHGDNNNRGFNTYGNSTVEIRNSILKATSGSTNYALRGSGSGVWVEIVGSELQAFAPPNMNAVARSAYLEGNAIVRVINSSASEPFVAAGATSPRFKCAGVYNDSSLLEYGPECGNP